MNDIPELFPELIFEIVDSLTDAALSSDQILYYCIGSSLELNAIGSNRRTSIGSSRAIQCPMNCGVVESVLYTEILKPGQLEKQA
ncbi:hypothetical protein OUZ56_002912 [Daphnia magna]|uniref:Uncharacterized protein n=1 Tax=Daphnia magna TaxID=35525 RepID=A0ABR0A756_9CRUS|nr:hypothetical protein OUZ56_002912 [Daphnia magna]